MKNDITKYIRVGTEYFKEVNIPLISGDTIKNHSKWNKTTIIDDFDKEAIKKIKKYEGFCSRPIHINYQHEIKGFLNKYEPLSHTNILAGDWSNIEKFLKHIFEEQYEIGLDYINILWKYPTQILPIFCLVSSERNTGKTTFLKFLKLIFEGNMTINKNEDFRSRFNQDWAAKLIIAIDEVLLDKKEDSERIKNLSTSSHYKAEAKGIDKVEIEFFGKFILCSNNEENFIKTDSNEIRYWVRKIKNFKQENPNLLEIMKSEIPSFIFYINSREPVTKKTTRMWFSVEQIKTDALDVLLNGNKSTMTKELEGFLIEQFHNFEVDELQYTIKDLIEELLKVNIRANQSYISKILKVDFGLEPRANSSSYKFLKLDLFSENGKWTTYHENKRGRFYTFKKIDFIKS